MYTFKKLINTMLLTLTSTLLLLLITCNTSSAQESYGKTLNAGLGIGYYGYIGNTLPVLHANYEFDVAKNFTLAPFISFYSYQKNKYWGNKNYPNRYYDYRVTVIPIGVKGTYYFDELFNASNNKWDFYASGSLGFAIRNTRWENGYEGERNVEHGSSGLYFDVHVGTEYHFNQKLGMFLDLSTGISTLGLAVHM